jgi:hypothetical protein
MATPTAEGWFFEEEMYKVLLSLKETYKLEILRENDIVREYGSSCYGIDFLLRGEKSYIFIQCKWQNNKSNHDAISKLRCACNDISVPIDYKKLHLFISKLPLTSIAMEGLLKLENGFNIYDDSGYYIMFNTLNLMKNKIIGFLNENNEPLNETNIKIEETDNRTINYSKKLTTKLTVVKIK